jgi:hypothetical protein
VHNHFLSCSSPDFLLEHKDPKRSMSCAIA